MERCRVSLWTPSLADDGVIPSDYWSKGERALPLWRFELYPSVGPQAEEKSPHKEDA